MSEVYHTQAEARRGHDLSRETHFAAERGADVGLGTGFRDGAVAETGADFLI